MASDTGGDAMIMNWNNRFELNNLTDFQAFRLFFGDYSQNEYRKNETDWRIRNESTNNRFLYVGSNGALGSWPANDYCGVRPISFNKILMI